MADMFRTLSAELDAAMAKQRQIQQAQERIPSAQAGVGIREHVLPLDGTASVNLGSGYGFLYRTEGSNPMGRLDVDMGGGVIQRVAPGTLLRSRFEECRVSISSLSVPGQVSTGDARLVVFTRPDAIMEEYQIPGRLMVSSEYTQDRATTNMPGNNETRGIDLVGVVAVRALVTCGFGRTIDTGKGIWWVSDSTEDSGGDVFMHRNVQMDFDLVPAGGFVVGEGGNLAMADLEVKVPFGHAYLELRDTETSDLSGTLTVKLLGVRG